MRKIILAGAAACAIALALPACTAQDAVAEYESDDDFASEFDSGDTTHIAGANPAGDEITAQEWDQEYYGDRAGENRALDQQIALVSDMTEEQKREYIRSRMANN